MKKLSIVPEDKCICVDGECYTNIQGDWSFVPSDVRAIQWKADDAVSGEIIAHVEYTDSSVRDLLKLGSFQQAVTLFNDHKATLNT